MALVPGAEFVAFGLSITPGQNSRASVPASGVSDTLAALPVVSAVVIWTAYPVYFVGRRGQTPGMRLMRIRLYWIDAEERLSAPGFGAAWARWAEAVGARLLVLYLAAAFDYAWSGWERRRQCLPDKAARTVALDERV